jgi:hypothetical protein
LSAFRRFSCADIRGDAKSREGGVKYTDFAMKKFFEMAEKQMVLEYGLCYIADHCASSAGKTELPVDKYRIPAMIYSPGFIQPQRYKAHVANRYYANSFGCI